MDGRLGYERNGFGEPRSCFIGPPMRKKTFEQSLNDLLDMFAKRTLNPSGHCSWAFDGNIT